MKGKNNVVALQGASPQGLRVVPLHVSQDTVSTLSRLLAEAQKGHVIGLAYIALMPAGRYQGDLIGIAQSYPIYTRGLLDALKEQCRC